MTGSSGSLGDVTGYGMVKVGCVSSESVASLVSFSSMEVASNPSIWKIFCSRHLWPEEYFSSQ
jgi:hypothetical protein